VHTPGKTDAAIAARQAFVFKSDPACSGAIFAAAPFAVMQLANNHAMDYGGEGLADTCAALDAAGIAHVGAGADYAAADAPVVIAARGVRVGFLAYSLIVPPGSAAGRDRPGLNTLPAQYAQWLRRDIAALRPQCDLVVVGFHWGHEGSSVPDADQRRIGRAAIDAGADLVIGGHPHTFQGVEYYGAGLIAYSMGNFCFSGASARLAGGILRVELEPGAKGTPPQRVSASLLPCWIEAGRPVPSADARLRSTLERDMRATGSTLGPDEDGWLAITPATPSVETVLPENGR
jgi:poly-gamma-glutamate synthesis protein (capsule biosynthesis protein)